MHFVSSLNSYSVGATFCFVFVALLVSCLPWSCGANGSARLIEPAMRSSLWRFNPKAPINFNDQALDCGGPQIQFKLNRGRCGICGDPYNERRENERGGRYAKGLISRRYRTGTKVTMIADLVAGNGGGYFEVKLCPRNSPNARITQACFDKYPLQIKNGNKRRLEIPANSDNPTGLYRMDVKLPKGVTCTHCVIQWHYHASNEWGYDKEGRGCMGCGPQTEIYNCADATIGYYGDPEGKLRQSADISVGTLAEVYNTYANGQYGTGVSPFILNSGIASGWASANDLTGDSTTTNSNNNNNQDQNEADDYYQEQPVMASSVSNRQSAGFANFFSEDAGGGVGRAMLDNYFNYDIIENNNGVSVPDYYDSYNNYNYYDGNDYALDLNMKPLGRGRGMGRVGGSGGRGGGGGESGEGGTAPLRPNTGRISLDVRTSGWGGGGSGGSSEEGGSGRGVNFRRNYAINIPSLSRQYSMLNGRGGGGGSSGSSEESVSRVSIPRRTSNVRSRPSNLLRIRDALRDIANRQQLRNGLHDLAEGLSNRMNDGNNNNNNNNNYDYYNDRNPVEFNFGGGSSSGERNVPTYFRDRLGGGSSGGSSSSDCSSEEGGCGGGVRVVDYYPDYPVEPVPDVIIPEDTGPKDYQDYTDAGPDRGDGLGGVIDLGGNIELGGSITVGGGGGVLDYGGIPDATGILDSIGGVNDGNYYQTQEDIDFIANRQAEFDRWREIEEEERQRMMKERGETSSSSLLPALPWQQPPMLPPWPYSDYNYNSYQQTSTSLLPQLQQTNPYYNQFNYGINNGNNMNSNLNLNYNPGAGLGVGVGVGGVGGINTPTFSSTLSRQYPSWQLPNNMMSAINTPSRLSRPFPQTVGYAASASQTNPRQQQESSDSSSESSQLFSWMPSANDVMTLGASKSPIFSQKVANQYLSPFLTLSQSHPALRCQRPDQLVCVATPTYRNIPDADSICTSKCRSGEACGSDYCSCACQKSLVCVHQSSGSASIQGGQVGVNELDMWCTNQCNAGQCPNQVCACSILL